MAERAEALAQEFEQANEAVIQTVEHCSDQQWQAQCAGEGWSVAATAHHIAEGHTALGHYLQLMANGQPLPPLSMEALAEHNAAHAQQYATCSKDEALAALRAAAQPVASALRGLSDEQLQRQATFAGREMTTEQFIRNVVIGHPRGHLQSIEVAISA